MTKICSKCGVEKSGLEFACRRAGHDMSGGLQAWCMECKNAHARGKKRERKEKKRIADLVWECQQREQIKQDKYEALKPK